MKHLLVCPEYPPGPIPPGGIGTYVVHISRLMAEAGETVHVMGTRWEGAPKAVEEQCGGRLIVHRVSMEDVAPDRPGDAALARREVYGLTSYEYRAQRFSSQCALAIERLVAEEGIDVIEGQDYDAPLYTYQLRRVIGAGPSHAPPCIVQLHSPTELIFRHNDWDPWRPDFLTAKRMEDFSIAAADALLCPSRFLAHEAESHYGLQSGSITVLRLPIGSTPLLERPAAVWESQRICYVGRLEPRKGVIEWVDAAVSICDDYPLARFALLGADLPYAQGRTVLTYLRSRIPARFTNRFDFRGSCSRNEVLAALERSAAAVVPSRWENFPNTCVEAMSTGTPVLATRNGGMAEMVEDGVSGWLVRDNDAVSLAEGLRRLLDTSPATLALMGKAAAARIRELCDNERTLQANLEFRARVAEGGTSRSHSLPANLPWIRRPLSEPRHRRSAGLVDKVGVILTARTNGDGVRECIDAVDTQTRPADARLLIVDETRVPSITASALEAERRGWTVLRCHTAEADSTGSLREAGLRMLLGGSHAPSAVLFLDANDAPTPALIEHSSSLLDARPEVGMVLPWTWHKHGERLHAPVPPALPYSVIVNESASAVLVRTEALREIRLDNRALPDAYESWDLLLRLLASDWAVLPFPQILNVRAEHRWDSQESPPAHGRLRADMLARIAPAVERDARELALLLEARSTTMKRSTFTTGVLTPLRVLRLPVREQLRLARRAASQPRAAGRWLIWHAWHLVRRSSGSGQSHGRPE